MRLMNHPLVSCIFALIWILFSSHVEAKSRHFFHFNFSSENQNWQGDFSDYPVDQEAFFELAWGWQNLPLSLKTTKSHTITKGLFLSGNNHSDDLFMFIRHRINGLKPHTNYDLIFNVIIENNIFPGQMGIGGSPGESVFFKVGASTEKPQKVDVNGFYVLNVDKGNQSTGGHNAIVVGNLANPLVDPHNPQFKPKHFNNQDQPLRIQTDSKGRLWLFMGTDSGFEGLTLYYIAHISIEAKRVLK